jgi:hypothetical protein
MRQKRGSKSGLSPAEITFDWIDFINKGSVIIPTLPRITWLFHENTDNPSFRQRSPVFAKFRQVSAHAELGRTEGVPCAQHMRLCVWRRNNSRLRFGSGRRPEREFGLGPNRHPVVEWQAGLSSPIGVRFDVRQGSATTCPHVAPALTLC